MRQPITAAILALYGMAILRFTFYIVPRVQLYARQLNGERGLELGPLPFSLKHIWIVILVASLIELKTFS